MRRIHAEERADQKKPFVLSGLHRMTENCHSEPVRAKNLASQPA